jgi:hypothetical protein
MMERELFRHCRVGFRARFALSCAIVLLASCVSAPHGPAVAKVADTKPRAPAADVQGIHAELSTAETINGGVALVRVKLPEGTGAADVSGQFADQDLHFFATGNPSEYEALIGVPFEMKPGEAKVELSVGTDREKEPRKIELPIEIRSGDYISEKLHVDPRKVEYKHKDVVRILREQKEIRRIYKVITPKKFWKGPFVLPIQSKVTSRYGNRRIFNGEMKSFHQGLDLRAKMRTPIHAPQAGRVVLAKNLFFTGNTVILDHGYGIFTIYAHMSHLKVKRGQVVQDGQLLGLSGMTGRAAGPHLHWGVVIGHTKVDPMEFVQALR